MTANNERWVAIGIGALICFGAIALLLWASGALAASPADPVQQVIAAGAGGSDAATWIGGGFGVSAVGIVGLYMLKILPAQREADRLDEKERRAADAEAEEKRTAQLMGFMERLDEKNRQERQDILTPLEQRMDKVERVMTALAGNPEITKLAIKAMSGKS